MYVKVLFDNKAKRGLLAGWGFSCLVDGKILFDTGEAASSLIENMDRMMVRPQDLEGVVISHDHWGHTSGLWELLKLKKGLKVYACPTFSETFKKCVEELGGKLVIVEKSMEIAPNIFVTGQLASGKKEDDTEIIPEQALVVKGDKGISVVTGCAHHGILNILKHIKTAIGAEKFYMVFGGFHLQGLDREAIGEIISGFKTLGVAKTGPAHCAGDKAIRIFSGTFTNNFVPVKAGQVIHL